MMRVALFLLVVAACRSTPPAPTVSLPHNHASAPSAPSVPVTPAPPELVELARILTPNLGPTVEAARVARLEATIGPINAPWNPERAALAIYRQQGRAVHLVGIARDEEDVSQLLRRLAVSSVFEDVRILTADRRADDLIGFEIDLSSVHADPRSRELVATTWPGLAHDPFHSIDVAPTPPPPSLVAAIELDRLKLIGIVTGDMPRALLREPYGSGAIVNVGDRIGTIWVVEQITAHEVVLVNNGPSGRIEKRLSL